MGTLLEHITELDPEDFIDLKDADSTTLLSGQASTASFLASLGTADDEILSADQAHSVRTAFSAITNPDKEEVERKKAIMALRAPAAVRHLAGMLSEYDWDFVEQAKELRGYVVAKLLEETKNPDPKIRLRALELTGKITEVGAFTERSEVVHRNASADELEARIRERLARLVPAGAQDVQTLEAK